MKTIFKPIESKLCTIQARYDVGAAIEYNSRKWKDGVAHAVEHMVYKQNNHLHDQFGLIGAEWNAYTSFNEICFMATVPSENISRLIELFSELLFDNIFDDDNWKAEQKVILEEESMIRNNVDRKIMSARDKWLCKGYLAKDIGGTKESIESITIQDLQDFYNTFITPDNLLVIITGKEDLRSDIVSRRYFRPNDGLFLGASENFKPNTFKTSKKKTQYFDQLIDQSKIFFSFPCEPSWDRENMVLNIISDFFCSGMDTRLFKKLREEYGLVYGVNGRPLLYGDIGWFQIAAATKKENTKEVIRVIKEEIESLNNDDISNVELEKALNKQLNLIYSTAETSYGYNTFLVQQITESMPSITQLTDLLKSITISEIKETITKVFNMDEARIFVASSKDQ